MNRMVLVVLLVTGAMVLASCQTHESRRYIVQTGQQDVRDVAAQVYGNPECWEPIARANPDVDPFMLRPGQELVIPPYDEQSESCPYSRVDIYGY